MFNNTHSPSCFGGSHEKQQVQPFLLPLFFSFYLSFFPSFLSLINIIIKRTPLTSTLFTPFFLLTNKYTHPSLIHLIPFQAAIPLYSECKFVNADNCVFLFLCTLFIKSLGVSTWFLRDVQGKMNDTRYDKCANPRGGQNVVLVACCVEMNMNRYTYGWGWDAIVCSTCG